MSFIFDSAEIDDVEDFLDRWSAFLVYASAPGSTITLTDRHTNYSEYFTGLIEFSKGLYVTPNGLTIDPVVHILEVR